MKESINYGKLMDNIKKGIVKTKEEKELKKLSLLLKKDSPPKTPEIQLVFVPVKEKTFFWRWILSFGTLGAFLGIMFFGLKIMFSNTTKNDINTQEITEDIFTEDVGPGILTFYENEEGY